MILPYSWIIFHYVPVPHVHCLLLCWWTLGSFRFLATAQRAARGTTRHASVGYDVESFGHVPRSGTAGAVVILLLARRGFPTLIFIAAVPAIPPLKKWTVDKGSPFPTSICCQLFCDLVILVQVLFALLRWLRMMTTFWCSSQPFFFLVCSDP